VAPLDLSARRVVSRLTGAGPCTRVAPRRASCPLAEACLVASLTDGPAGTWRPLPDRLGIHDREAILDAASDLAREGFLELHEGRVRVRA
jgi:hypothetical protein